MTASEFVHCLRRQDFGPVVRGCGMMDFMNRSSRVNNFWSHSFFFDNRLDVLVNVVVPSLTGGGRCFRRGMGGVMDGRRVFILGFITFKESFNFLVIAVLISSFFSG